MSAADVLIALVEACQCEVSVTVNEHRNYYESVDRYMNDRDRAEDVEPDVLAEMVRRNVIVQVQAHPNTPIGFYSAFHWDLETALRQVLDAVRQEG